MLAEGGKLDTGFSDDKRTIRRSLDGVGVFACLGGLSEIIREKLMHVGFAVAVGIAQPPDAVAIEDEQVVSSHAKAERFVQSRGKAPPRNFVQLAAQSREHPDVAVKRDRRRAAIAKKCKVGKPHVAFPR